MSSTFLATGSGTRISSRAAAGPIRVRGVAHSARKCFWEGTQRVVPPAETLARIRPHFASIGLTRLANITGLDRIGIPTVLSIRPNSTSLSADAGKGFTLEAAMASAAMECVERFYAETARLPEIRTSYERVADSHAVVPFEQLPVAKGGRFTPHAVTRWTAGWDLVGQRDVAAPTALVAMDRHLAEKNRPMVFQGGSNGLAAGNTLLEAVTGGLFEVVERDAVACHRVAGERLGRTIPRVRLDTITHPLVRDLLDRFAAAGVSVVLFDCSVDTDVPVYMAYVYDRELRNVGIYRGYGAHLDPGIAMIRALTEAVQARLIFIAGSRDDFFRHNYLRLKQYDDAEQVRQLEAIPATVDAGARANAVTTTFEGDVHAVLQRLAAVGLTTVLVFEIPTPGLDVSVLRVMVPGLEGYMFDSYAPGPRARAFVEAMRS